MRRRTSDEGDFASMNFRTASRSWSCSSENVNVMLSPSSSRLTREPEHPLTDDVVLDLAGARVDRLCPADHEDALRLVEDVLPAPLAPGEKPVRAANVPRGLAQAPGPPAPTQPSHAPPR